MRRLFAAAIVFACLLPSVADAGGLGPRPRAWCGWEMRRVTGHYDPALNLARNWLRKFPRTIASAGAIVVWGHGKGRGHVGRIVRMTGACTAIVYSGNDGGAARTRERNICNALGFVRA